MYYYYVITVLVNMISNAVSWIPLGLSVCVCTCTMSCTVWVCFCVSFVVHNELLPSKVQVDSKFHDN